MSNGKDNKSSRDFGDAFKPEIKKFLKQSKHTKQLREKNRGKDPKEPIDYL